VIKSRRMRQKGQIAGMGETKLENAKRRNN
jgi:hypothetical protein